MNEMCACSSLVRDRSGRTLRLAVGAHHVFKARHTTALDEDGVTRAHRAQQRDSLIEACYVLLAIERGLISDHIDPELLRHARAIDLTEALLLLSRTDQQDFAQTQVDLSLVAEEATETLLPFAEKHGVVIETSGDTTLTIGSAALLLQLTTNLVHNAIVHNLPEGGTVWVVTSLQPKSVALFVENTGETLTSTMVERLIEPFEPGTERIHTDRSGLGLGLTIVQSITQAHRGTLTLAPRPAGGLCVTVQLPAALPHCRAIADRDRSGIFMPHSQHPFPGGLASRPRRHFLIVQ